jgi:GNAT superfamily N-acetyltransferase
MSISLRPIREQDRPFLLEIYSVSRSEELEHVSWTESQKRKFLQQQFTAQQRYFQEQFLGGDFYVVEEEGIPIGRFYLVRWPHEIRVLDLTIDPRHRRRGIGSRLISELFGEADAAGIPIRVHLEVYNRSRYLYAKLGFSHVEDRGAFLLMSRAPHPVMDARQPVGSRRRPP